MYEEEISDYRLQKMFKAFIATQHPATQQALKGLLLCGNGPILISGRTPAAFVLSNGEKSRITGVNTCKSAWACPHCTAIVLAKKAADIACAIDLMATKYNQYAMMLTFTFPHIHSMTCQECYEVITKSWFKFSTNNSTRSIFRSFREKFGIDKHVRAYEFTHGKNSWHPHIHALFFVPKENFTNEILDWEKKLGDHWRLCCKNTMAKYTLADTDEVFDDEKHKGHNGFYISKDNKGDLLRITSSLYMTGLKGHKGDLELTGEKFKVPKSGHLNPSQIIARAYEEKDRDKKQYYLKLYLDYALTTRKRRRIEFSKTKDGWSWKKEIAEWKQTQAYTEKLKKKGISKENAKWNLVYWFTKKQWLLLCEYEITRKEEIIAEILKRARLPDATEKIDEFLITIDTDLINVMKYRDFDVIKDKFNLAA